MDPRYQKNNQSARPGAAQRPAQAAAAQTAEAPYQPQHGNDARSSKGFPKKWLISLLVLALLVVGGWFTWTSLAGSNTEGVKKDKYQAVFLVNDQVYFGKITQVDDEVLVINDIYYLQQTQKEGQGAASQNQNAATAQETNTSLAKLGSEVHGPEDEMRINMDQVLFWENLKDDGQVSKAIKEYKK